MRAAGQPKKERVSFLSLLSFAFKGPLKTTLSQSIYVQVPFIRRCTGSALCGCAHLTDCRRWLSTPSVQGHTLLGATERLDVLEDVWTLRKTSLQVDKCLFIRAGSAGEECSNSSENGE